MNELELFAALVALNEPADRIALLDQPCWISIVPVNRNAAAVGTAAGRPFPVQPIAGTNQFENPSTSNSPQVNWEIVMQKARTLRFEKSGQEREGLSD
jgi:hypothetical protein